jgi:outer membrane protein assembly factor BamB
VGSLLYLTSYAGHLQSYDTATGRFGAAAALGAGTVSSPAISDGLVYLGTTDGRLLCLR